MRLACSPEHLQEQKAAHDSLQKQATTMLGKNYILKPPRAHMPTEHTVLSSSAGFRLLGLRHEGV
eukprot:736451-Amphidinium_carterae.1